MAGEARNRCACASSCGASSSRTINLAIAATGWRIARRLVALSHQGRRGILGIVSKIAAVVLFATLWTTDSFAQGLRNKFSTELSSVSELYLTTGRLEEQAKRCGLAAGDLETPARRALEASKLRMIQSATNFVFVKANVVAVDDSCSAAISVELFRWSNEYRTSVSVWAHDALIVGGRDGFNGRVREKVETLTKEFIADWLKARQ